MLLVLGAQAQVKKIEHKTEPEFSTEIQMAVDRMLAEGHELSPEYLGTEPQPMLLYCGPWTTNYPGGYFCGDNICINQVRSCGGVNEPATIEYRTIRVFLE